MNISELLCFDMRCTEVDKGCVPLTTLAVFVLLIQLTFRKQFGNTVVLIVACVYSSQSFFCTLCQPF